ncbi:hypothetical protein LJR130_003835 [Variovorax sp. LjRoot130]|uniref:hypothetical protein n=1 Tax=Variovorax sp. LjRoot130 TaxID=3342261 RepID=UPI003ECEE198
MTGARKMPPGKAVVKARIRASSISIEYEGSLSEDVALQIYRMLVSGEMNPTVAPGIDEPDTPQQGGPL